MEPFLQGIKPAVMAIMGALWRVGKSAVKSWSLIPIGVAVSIALLH
ncbi:MAG: hypothetical protein OXE59_06105 [Bacteroidetes bacterium]|nr:hypothetical protein [Bacteroidota bacterium]MCY4233297.1 hypothetical protein [Bacteroidota bacterium]